MRKDVKTWQIRELEELFPRINFPEYQREPTVWSRDAKQRLIDSIMRMFDIASIYIYADGEATMDCVDGRQRLNAIMSFIGRNPDDPDQNFSFRILNEVYEDAEHPFGSLEDKTFLQIEKMARNDTTAKQFIDRLRDYRLTVTWLSESGAEKEFNLQFARLNLGTIINSGEKLHAMVGDLRDICFNDIGGHGFLADANVRTHRYSREQLAAQIIAQVFAMERSGDTGNREYARTRHFDLQRLFKQHTTISEEEKGWVARTEKVLDCLQPAFAGREALRSRAIVVSTVLLAYEEGVDSEETAATVAEFVDEFVRCLKWQLAKGFDMDHEFRYLLDFQRHVTQASVEKPAVEARARMFREGLQAWREAGELLGDKAYKENHPERDAKTERRG